MNIDSFSVLVIIFALVLSGVWFWLLNRDRLRMQAQIQELARHHSLLNDSDQARMLCRAIQRLRPSVHPTIDYVIASDDGRSAHITEWRSQLPRPTEQELAAAVVAINADDATGGYAARRRAEYPSIGDQLDAAYKARQGSPHEQQELDRQIGEIKRKYAKPDECA